MASARTHHSYRTFSIFYHFPILLLLQTKETMDTKEAMDDTPATRILDDIPANLFWPGEWAEHQACLILYPHNTSTFRLQPAQEQGTLVF